MTCEKPGITPITDECCFSCYTVDRTPYNAPIAIVLHEVDEHIEALNNRLENCCHDDPDCHSSFHYGVGHDGRIINWVDPANTAWSFDPTNSDQNCGICGWSIATQEGTGVDPNLYTINIAVSTGILAFDQSSPNSLAENNYGENQYDALVRLVGWLAETYGITVNQNTIWRHCDELDDFPAGCCCAECGPCQTYSDFLTAVQECIDGTEIMCPQLCDCLTDADLSPGAPAFIFGANDDNETCGRFAFDLCSMFTGLPEVCETMETLYLVGVDDQAVCSYIPVPMTCNTTEPAHAALAVDASGCLALRPVSDHLVDREAVNGQTLQPATDRVVTLDATNNPIIFTLTPPGPCDPQDFWIKRKDCNDGNTVTINGGPNTIDTLAAIQLGTPGPYGGCGETVHLYWDGSNWLIL